MLIELKESCLSKFKFELDFSFELKTDLKLGSFTSRFELKELTMNWGRAFLIYLAKFNMFILQVKLEIGLKFQMCSRVELARHSFCIVKTRLSSRRVRVVYQFWCLLAVSKSTATVIRIQLFWFIQKEISWGIGLSSKMQAEIIELLDSECYQKMTNK